MAISGREKTAVRLFASGVNCAQAVLMTYADIAGLTQEQAARVACGLGGGIGRLRDNCGAFSSAVMLCAALMIPGMADGNRMVRMVCHFPAPSPTAPCLVNAEEYEHYSY